MKTAKEILIGTKEAITKLGWCQGVNYQDKLGKRIEVYSSFGEDAIGACCLSGALSLASDFDYSYPGYDGAVYALLGRVKSFSIPVWNDQFGRTKEEVLELLDQAIASLE